MRNHFISLLRPFWNLYKAWVLEPLFRVKDTWLVWKLANRRSVALQKKHPLPLGSVGQRILDDLYRDGISITHIDELFPHTEWFERLSAYARAQQEHAFQNQTKPFWNELWDMRNFCVDLANPFLRFSLEDTNLAIANAYLGMYSRFHSLSLSESIPVAPGAEPVKSQKWHRDTGNKKYVKMFVYLNDVDLGGGPFTYVKGSQPGGKWWHIFPQVSPYSPMYGRIEDHEMDVVVPPGDIIRATGRAGTVVFADTTGLHKGSYSTHTPRLASITTFYSDKSHATKKNESQLRYPPDFAQQYATLSPVAQFALERRI